MKHNLATPGAFAKIVQMTNCCILYWYNEDTITLFFVRIYFPLYYSKGPKF